MIQYTIMFEIVNPFPGLLMFGFFAPLLIRVAIGLIFIWIGYTHLFKNRKDNMAAFQQNPPGITAIRPAISRLAPFTVWVFGITEIVIGSALIVGFYTQIAALIGIVIALKTLYFKRKYKLFAFYSPAFYLLTMAVLLSLLLTGAGALAFDLPL